MNIEDIEFEDAEYRVFYNIIPAEEDVNIKIHIDIQEIAYVDEYGVNYITQSVPQEVRDGLTDEIEKYLV